MKRMNYKEEKLNGVSVNRYKTKKKNEGNNGGKGERIGSDVVKDGK